MNELEIRHIDYKFWKDPKMMGMIILILSATIQIFSFMEIPVLTTINAYTVGMMFGAANPFFYAFMIYISLTMIFKDSIKMPSWIKLTKISYWFVAISVMFIIGASGHYQSKTSWTSIGSKSFQSMDIWFKEFRSKSPWYPASIWGGAVGAFLYSVFAIFASGIGALIVAIIFPSSFIFIISHWNFVGLYKGIAKKKHMELAKKEMTIEYVSLSQMENVDLKDPNKNIKIKEIENGIVLKDDRIKGSKNTKRDRADDTKTTSFPFEDPFKE